MDEESNVGIAVLSDNLHRTHEQVHVVDPNKRVVCVQSDYRLRELLIDLVVCLPVIRCIEFKTTILSLEVYLSVGATKLWKKG